jgi:TRAP-type transport system small permease protein
VVMMMATVADVTLRYSLNRPIPGTYDLVECMLVVFVFNGLAATFLQRRNIAIDIIDHFVGPRGITLLVRLTDVVSIAMLGIVVWAMVTPATQAYDYGDRKLELALPLYVLWAVAMLGMAGSILAAICALLSPVSRSTGDDPA